MIREDPSDSYIKFILDDEATVENAMAKFKAKFPNAVLINYANKSVFDLDGESLDIDLDNKHPLELLLTLSILRTVESLQGQKLKS